MIPFFLPGFVLGAGGADPVVVNLAQSWVQPLAVGDVRVFPTRVRGVRVQEGHQRTSDPMTSN
jgi:hypothetical protein